MPLWLVLPIQIGKTQHLKSKKICGRSPLTKLELLRTTYPYLLAIGRIPWSNFSLRIHTNANPERKHWHQKTPLATAQRLKSSKTVHGITLLQATGHRRSQNATERNIAQQLSMTQHCCFQKINAQKTRWHSTPGAAIQTSRRCLWGMLRLKHHTNMINTPTQIHHTPLNQHNQ